MWGIVNPLVRKAVLHLTLSVVPLLTTACAQPVHGMDETLQSKELNEIASEIAVLRSRISEQIGDPVADDASECGILPLGAKACGGPDGYIVFSRRVTDTRRLEPLLKREAELSRRSLEIRGEFGVCVVAQKPDPMVVDGRCRPSYDRPDTTPR